MKKIHLHGDLGKRFGETWDLDVSSAAEAMAALCANNFGIQKYLQEAYSSGISYGIKKDSGEILQNKEEFELISDKDFHIFPIPEGSQGFALNLLVMVATTAASMYIQKKIAESMERDDSVLQAQTQSFIYTGKQNRFEQGSSVPLGYGRMNVGTNVVSACSINYDFSAEKVKLFNFEEGLYSLVPFYHNPELYNEFGPLGASFGKKTFDGTSEYRVIDPSYQKMKLGLIGNAFGVVDGMYGSARSSEDFKNSITNINECKGGAIAGYYCYTWDWAKGVNKALLPNFDENTGNWYADSSKIDNKMFSIPASEAVRSGFVCIQSDPKLETEQLGDFYPIFWSEESLNELKRNLNLKNYLEAFPVPVGERWINGKKENGLGWFKLESTTVHKAIDLICEGSIDGFASKNGELLDFSKDFKTNDANLNKTRNEDDDYLQAVYLDSTPVKEVNYTAGLDSYNINEFDIDVGMNSKGTIGADDQLPLKEQYRFTADTKEINAPLYGPRAVGKTFLAEGELEAFQPKKIYEQGSVVLYEQNGGFVKYKINKNLSAQFSDKENYSYEGDISKADIVYTGEDGSVQFLVTGPGIGEYKVFGEQQSYTEGDKIKTETYDGHWEYYELGSGAENYLGDYNKDTDYSGEVGKIIKKKDILYKIKPGKVTDEQTGEVNIDPNFNEDALPGGDINLFADVLSVTIKEEGQDEERVIYNDHGKILSEQQGFINKQINITPESEDDKAESFWQKIYINSPVEVKNNSDEDITNEISIFGPGGSYVTSIEKSIEEENYASHTIINPLVEQAHVSLQIDELMYVYEGDNVDVTYKIGELWSALLDGFLIYQTGLLIYRAVNIANFTAMCSSPSLDPKINALACAALKAEIKVAVVDVAIEAVLIGIKEYINSNDGFKVGTKVENSGESWPNRAKFRIKYGNEGEIMYSTDVYMYGIATSAYRKDVKLYMPPNPGQKNRIIKVYKLNREKNLVKEGEQAARYKEKMSLAAITEITPVNLSYPNSVVIGTRVNARDYANIPERNYHLRLKKVALPDEATYDPETRRYLQNWNGLFSGQEDKNDPIPENAKRWTDNPAWCLYDLIADKRYGVGKFGIKPEHIDRWTLYKMSKYCDEFIPTGYSPKFPKRKFSYNSNESGGHSIIIDGIGNFASEFNHPNKKLALFYEDGTYDSLVILSTAIEENKVILKHKPLFGIGECAVEIDYPLVEPRYTLNAFIMNQSNAFKLINEFASIFRAFSYWSGGAINFFQDEKRESVMLFSNNNIAKEGFAYSNTPRTSRTNVCKIKYLDRYNHFRPKMEHHEDRDSVIENNIIEQTIDGFGITSQAQAKRAAEFLVKSANLETEIVAFKTNLLGSYLRPGDIVDILDSKRNVGKFSGKILDIEASDDGRTGSIKVDYPISCIIDPTDMNTWRKVTLYKPSQNQTSESLDAMGSPEDRDIDDIRKPQIIEYFVSEVYENDTRLKLYNNPYEFIEGEYTWYQALADAEERGGVLARIYNEDELNLVKEAIPVDKSAWIGGYYRRKPEPAKAVWHEPKSCEPGGEGIEFFDWAGGYPQFNSQSNPGDYLKVNGSTNMDIHGDWTHDDGKNKIGYLLEKVSDNDLRDLIGIEGTTFSLQSDVNLANKKQFKIINITEEFNGIFNIQGLEYNADKFDNIEKHASIQPPTRPVLFTDKTLAPPADVRVEILNEDFNNKIPYGLKAIWRTDPAAASYRIQFFDQNDLLSTFEINNDKGQGKMSYTHRNKRISEDGTYYVRIYSVPF
jgi:predicted phage tail protein